RLKFRLNDETPAMHEIAMQLGQCEIDVQPRILGDETILLEAEGLLECVWRGSGQFKPLRIHRSFSNANRIRNGDTMQLTGSTFRLGSGKSALTADMLLYLTPRIGPDIGPSVMPSTGSQPAALVPLGAPLLNTDGVQP